MLTAYFYQYWRALSVMIRDTGIGMSSEQIRDALELFREVDNSLSRRFEGAAPELHGGTLTINSTLPAGTAVVVRFPANRITWNGAR